MTETRIRGKPIKREKIFLNKTDTRPNSARKINTKRRRRSVTWGKFNTPKNLTIIAGLCRKGWTNTEIAEYIGISESTLYDWTKKHPEFSEILSTGKEYCIAQVENALFQRALGIEKTATETSTYSEDIVKNGQKIGEKRTKKEDTKYVFVPPDTKAAIFYLTNRCGDDWKQKQSTEITGNLHVDAAVQAVDRLQKSIQRKEQTNEVQKEAGRSGSSAMAGP